MSTSEFTPAGDSTAPPVPPSGNGASEATAQYTAAFASDTTQASYTVYRMLKSIEWLRCTLDEAKYYKDLNYQVYKANGQLFRPRGTEVATGAPDPVAFHHHFEDVVKAERPLETAGVRATHDEGLMDEAADLAGAADQADSSSESSKPSVDVFDKHEPSKVQSPRGNGRGGD